MFFLWTLSAITHFTFEPLPVFTSDSRISSSPSVKFSSRFEMLGERKLSGRRRLNVKVPFSSPVSGPSVAVFPSNCLIWNGQWLHKTQNVVTLATLPQFCIFLLLFAGNVGRSAVFELGDVDYQFAACFVPFTMIRLLLDLLMYSLPSRSIFQRKFRQNATKLVWPWFGDAMKRNAEPEKELMITINNSSMNNIQNNDALGTVGKEVNQFLLKLRGRVMFTNQLQAVPWSFTFTGMEETDNS